MMNEQAYSLTGIITLALRLVVGWTYFSAFKGGDGNTVFDKQAEELARFPESGIYNHYIAKVKPGKHSLVIPLGAKARLVMDDPALAQLPDGKYTLVLTDITGTTWEQTLTK